MMIESICPECQKPFKASDKDVGRVYVCKQCGIECIVPSLKINPGDRFGRYEVQYPLGSGASSEVHLAVNVETNEHVALKILFVDESTTLDIKRFFRESKNASTLDHPGLIRIYEMGSEDDLHYLAMEYVDGQTLDKFLEDHGALSEIDALSVARDVAAVLEYAWEEKELVHRDIKPSNMMLSYDGRTKLMDLGIAKSLMYDVTQLTEEDTILGTPIYMSPEQCAPGKPINFHADIYALGATLFHLVTNRYPYTGNSPMDLVRKHLFSKVPDPREFRPDLHEHTVHLIQKMMAKRVSQRPETWGDVIRSADHAIQLLTD